VQLRTVPISRAQLGLAGLALLAALVGGVSMQLELLAPGGTWSKEWYGTSILVHGVVLPAFGTAVFAGGFGYAAIERLLGARLPAPAIGWVGVGLWTIGLIATVASWFTGAQDSGWTLYTPYSLDASPGPPLAKLIGPLAFGGAALVYGLHLASMVAANSKAPPLRLVLGGALVLVTLWSAIGDMREAFALYPINQLAEPSLLLALIIVTIGLAGTRDVLAVIAIGCAAVFVFATSSLFALGIVCALGLVGVWIALGIIGGFGRPVVAFAVFGIGFAIVMLGLARVFVTDPDVPLHDTHFEVGLVHLVGMISVFAAIGAAHTFAASRVPNAVLAWCGALVATTGTIVHAYASMKIGAMGMPMRYWDYDPSFTAGHWVAGAGAGITILGFLLIAISWLSGRRAR
jgi:hypothetical protein